MFLRDDSCTRANVVGYGDSVILSLWLFASVLGFWVNWCVSCLVLVGVVGIVFVVVVFLMFADRLAL